MSQFPKVFIVILNYNGKDVIQRCLSSVFKNDYPNFEVVVVDNDSQDGSLELAKTNFSKANFIKNDENLGFARGNNVGIRFSLERMADFVLLLNNDTEVEKDFLSRMIEVAETDEKIGLLSPVIFNGYNKKTWFSGGRTSWLTMKTKHNDRIMVRDYYPSEFISGCSMLVRSTVFDKVGLFDEDFFLYWEDADLSFRAKRAGFKNIIVAGSWVYHFERSERNIENKTYWLVVSGLLFFKKNTPLYLRPWIVFYLLLRKTKNRIDLILGRGEVARAVRRAYKDFKNAGF